VEYREGALEGLVNASFWAGRRVFLTGHTGFKGSWLSLWLQHMGAQVTGYALAPPTSPSLFEVANVSRNMRSITGDIRDQAALSHAVAEAHPEIVIHMAAQSLVRLSYETPVETYATNVMGTVNLLEAVRQTSGIKAVVNVTSDKCYENKEWVWGYRESDPMGGYDPYSNSKGCAELVTSAFRNSFFNPSKYGEHGVAVASARAGNVIGGGDWARDRLIPDILAGFQRGESVLIRNPHAIRPWQHVLEPLQGYLLLAERLIEHGPQFAEAWNFGPRDQDARPVDWIVKRMVELWGPEANWCLAQGEHPHEASYLKLDASKACMRLGWSPRWELDLALRRIVEWHRAFLADEDMRLKSITQIMEFQRNCKEKSYE